MRRMRLKCRLAKNGFAKSSANFLRTHDTGVLATGEENKMRATPIEYVIYDGAFYCFSEGGHKFSYMWKNKRASLPSMIL